MGFNRDEISELLVRVRRRCSICHRFCGVKIETDHIVQGADGGTDAIENAIPVCFECHAEIHSYNNQHPRGRKFLPDELRAHKEQWLETCRDHPELFVAASRPADVGPLQALIDELEFNLVVCEYSDFDRRGALFANEQFCRAIAHGAVAILELTLKRAIHDAYAAMSCANQRILAEINQDPRGQALGTGRDAAQNAMTAAAPKVKAAHERLLRFLSSEGVPEAAGT